MIEAEIAGAPYGELEGAPALILRISPDYEPGSLLKTVAVHMRPGVSVVWIAAAPWGNEALDIEVQTMLDSDRFAHVAVVAVQGLTAGRWSSVSKLRWIVDVSDLFGEPLTEQRLVDALEATPYLPAVHEILVRRPALLNLTPMLLDAIFQYLSPEGGGYVYVRPTYGEAAVQALSRCTHLWARRFVDP